MGAAKIVYEFGPFRVDPEQRVLLREGQPIAITPKAFDTLLILVQRSREVVSKDELLKMVWPDAFVEEGNLSQNIFTLRKALSDQRDERKYIITLPGRGYRFAVEVRTVQDEGNDLLISRQSKAEIVFQHANPPEPLRQTGVPLLVKQEAQLAVCPKATAERATTMPRTGKIVLMIATVVLATLLLLAAISQPPALRVVRITPITNSGKVEPWGRIRVDGSKIYFLERHGSAWPLMQVSTSGGLAAPAAAPFPNTRVLDVSSDGTQLLVASFSDLASDMPLSIMETATGGLRRVGDVNVHDAAWYPDGTRILCSRAGQVFSIKPDGSDRKELFQVGGEAEDFVWRRDGSAFRFSVKDAYEGVSLWEASPSSKPREMLPGWTKPSSNCCGAWAPDSRYFFFASGHGGSPEVWALAEGHQFSWFGAAEPQRLTNGPHSYDFPVPGTGNRIFVIGLQYRTSEFRYDAQQSAFVPFGPEGSFDLAFSPDHQWMAYVGANGGLWRSRLDGSERLQLTVPPLVPLRPRWSPDGTKILFKGYLPGGPGAPYVVPAGGGPPEILLKEHHWHAAFADWSPDGRFVVADEFPEPGASPGIYKIDLNDNSISRLPGSEAFTTPRWSPDGRYIAARLVDETKVFLFDMQAEQWRPIVTGKLITRYDWDRSGRTLYFQDLLDPQEAVFQFDVLTGNIRKVMDFRKLLQNGAVRCAYEAFAPDGSMLASVRSNVGDIYAIDLDVP